MPLKATMAKPIIQYPVYAVKSDVDTERSNQTSILKPMPLKATMAKPRNPNRESSKIFSNPLPTLHAKQGKPNNTKPGTDFYHTE